MVQWWETEAEFLLIVMKLLLYYHINKEKNDYKVVIFLKICCSIKENKGKK